VFTAWYALSPCIKRKLFIFKGLIISVRLYVCVLTNATYFSNSIMCCILYSEVKIASTANMSAPLQVCLVAG
jgi:hypothetical protein